MDPNTNIRIIMTEATLNVSPIEPFTKIETIFKNYPFHHIPVIEKDQSVVGIISRMDVSNFRKKVSLESSGQSYSQNMINNTYAKDIMTSEPTILDPDDTIGLAADIFLANKFHALPVTEDNKLVGIVTTHDLLQYAFKEVIYGTDDPFVER